MGVDILLAMYRMFNNLHAKKHVKTQIVFSNTQYILPIIFQFNITYTSRS